MAATEDTLTGLGWQIFANVVASLLVGWGVGVLDQPHFQAIGSGVLVFAVFGFIIYRRNRRLLKLLWSGWFPAVYYTFPVEENPRVWDKAQHCIKYFGISGSSIIDEFRTWSDDQRSGSSVRFCFLLMDPDSADFAAQEAHKLGLDPNDARVIEETKIARERTRTTIDLLKQLEAYKNNRLEIRLHNEFLPWWIYFLDDDHALVGVLEKGKDSRNSPALLLKKHPHYPSLFNSFQAEWDRKWARATRV